MVEEYGLDNRPLSDSVVELIEHIWREAIGEIEDVIASPLQSIKLDQVCDMYLILANEGFGWVKGI